MLQLAQFTKCKQNFCTLLYVINVDICVCRYLTASATFEEIGRSDAWVWILLVSLIFNFISTFSNCACIGWPQCGFYFYKMSDVTYGLVGSPILAICALHLIHPKCTHTPWTHTHTHTHTVNTHPEQWAAIYSAAPGDLLGVRCLAQGFWKFC